MTSVNVTTQKNIVTVQEGDATIVTVTTQGAQGATGAGVTAGDKGSLTVAANLTDWTLNDSVVTNAKVSASAAIAGTKISPDFGNQNITTTGNAVFGGNLTVSGSVTTIDTTTLRVEDKNIELAKVGSPTDITADGGGITLLGDTNHTFNWLNATDSWTSSEHIALPDNKKLQLGDSQDLQIFHTGIHSHIRDAGSGSLLLQGSKIVVQNADGSETNASFTENGAVELYHDAVKKLETTSNGATVNGHLLASTDGNTTISLLDTGHGFPQSEIKLSNGGRDLNIVAPKDIRIFPQSGENGIVIEANGQVELYHDNVKKAETSADGLNVTDGRLFLYNSTIPHIRLNKTSGDTASTRFILGIATGTDSFITGATQNTCCIKTGGNNMMFGIGTDKKLEINSDGLSLPDNSKIQFGDSQDLAIFHNSTDSFIENITGNLHIRPKASEEGIILIPDGGVELYHNNVRKIHTTSWGSFVTGTLQAANLAASTGYIHVESDNQPVKVGVGGDLSLLHDGTDSKITNITGNLLIEPKSGETAIKAIPDGAVELYHNGVKKAETTADGFDVFNRVRALGGSASIHLNTDATGANTSTRAMFGLANSTNVFIIGATTNDVVLNTPHRFLVAHGSTEIMAIFDPDGAVELYHDAVKKAETTADGFQIQDNLTISSDNPKLIFDQTSSNIKYKIEEGSGLLQLKISSNGGVSYASAISIGGVGNIFIPDNDKVNFGSGNDLVIVHDGSDSKITNKTGNLTIEAKDSETGIKVIPDGAVQLYFDNNIKFTTEGTGVKVFGMLVPSASGSHPLGIDVLRWNGLFMSGDIDLLDNNKLKFGDNDDLQLYHDGSNSFIDNSSGSIYIRPKAGEDGIRVNPDNGVQLYHDNTQRLSTSAIGVSVTGKITTSGDIIINSDYPVLSFIDTNNDSDYRLTNANGNFLLYDISNAATRFTVTSGGLIKVHGNVEPEADNTRALGSSSKRFSTLHSAALNTGDINMSNLNDSPNEVDGSKGSWTLQEGADDLFIINRVSGKKYKFNLTEIS